MTHIVKTQDLAINPLKDWSETSFLIVLGITLWARYMFVPSFGSLYTFLVLLNVLFRYREGAGADGRESG